MIYSWRQCSIVSVKKERTFVCLLTICFPDVFIFPGPAQRLEGAPPSLDFPCKMLVA